MMLDAKVVAKRHEPRFMQLGPINGVTYQCLMAHGSGSQHPEVAPRHSGNLIQAIQEMDAVDMTIAPIITNLAPIEKRLENIESMQLELKKAHDEGQEDIMERIDDVKFDFVQEMKKNDQ
ncbi:hypothetical protein CJ030_MR5G020707 [Morella rubra]|uniref:Uncharacterized protein n=1 Tax=Morella rubra TaxID=262757 RepID=A0A6A1VKL0_9ROSI|nr:hypothetical protein CJ030_MR5G025110 [Morella rubra]KAB1212386.1 hypothetical protein CJ030_MR5G020707 [Morella rubra]